MMAQHEARELSSEEETAAGEDLRRGPWTVEEDLLLVNYIAAHGEGRWNALARCAGLKRTGKSCRLRWLNYLRPDVRRGNMTAEEQLLILELHGRWGNRWSKIAQHLPGRTDNEIKNYWRTRVQKHAKHLNCDVNSQQFKDLMRYLWMPRLLERIHRSSPSIDTPDLSAASCVTAVDVSSSSSVDGGGGGAHQPQLLSPLAVATEGSSNAAAMWQQAQMSSGAPPPPTTTTQQLPAAACQSQFDQFGCWSESLPGLAAFYDDVAPPDFDVGGVDSMWGAASCAEDDDPWYTQMLGAL
ncbi:hypothetical protein E2562_018411 [Oryza meyeriana var. granulata]|uniref:Uncharacterized protein n=1 Tax=Oryza meyeriana var. granulata TaxID=110450 RepID=A0A6G1D5D8_9ORYZ|nr:hypothetical protein E2562_018411 [Oryza meyeriana var. granulata]